MADNSMELLALLRKVAADSDVDTLREAVRVMAQAIMEEEVTEIVGAERGVRSQERTGHRNGYRDRDWDTRVGSIELKVPRVRDGGYIPSLLEARRRDVGRARSPAPTPPGARPPGRGRPGPPAAPSMTRAASPSSPGSDGSRAARASATRPQRGARTPRPCATASPAASPPPRSPIPTRGGCAPRRVAA